MATFTENRASRLRDGGTATLFHNTDADRKIISEQRMVRGSSGWAGGGIYFAGSENETLQKTQNKGRTLEARVKLGRVLVVTTSSVKDFSFTELQNMGFDSVKITGIRTGDEYVVYNGDQVGSIVGRPTWGEKVARKVGQKMQNFLVDSLRRVFRGRDDDSDDECVDNDVWDY